MDLIRIVEFDSDYSENPGGKRNERWNGDEEQEMFFRSI